MVALNPIIYATHKAFLTYKISLHFAFNKHSSCSILYALTPFCTSVTVCQVIYGLHVSRTTLPTSTPLPLSVSCQKAGKIKSPLGQPAEEETTLVSKVMGSITPSPGIYCQGLLSKIVAKASLYEYSLARVTIPYRWCYLFPLYIHGGHGCGDLTFPKEYTMDKHLVGTWWLAHSFTIVRFRLKCVAW